jgi:trimethylguanosine synthase
MDPEGWWSVTPEKIAEQIAERCRYVLSSLAPLSLLHPVLTRTSRCNCIVDAFCGVGGNAIQFAFTCERVIAIDNSPLRLALARHNATVYGVADRITFILGDFVEWARHRSVAVTPGSEDPSSIDVVFLSPPWGGMDYLSSVDDTQPPPPPTSSNHSTNNIHYPLSALEPIPGPELYALSRALTHNVAMYLPRNTDVAQVAALSPDTAVELEEEWMGGKLKALTAYFGDLGISPATTT